MALAAAVMLFVRPPPQPAFELGPLPGGIVDMKSTVDGSAIFAVGSRLRWVLVPTRAIDDRLFARAFESAPPGAPLSAQPADGLHITPDNAVVLDPPAAALFRAAPGPRVVWVGLALDAAALDAAAGAAPPVHPDADGVRWYSTPAEYRAR